MPQLEDQLEKIFVMFANESSKMPLANLIPALQCSGVVVGDEFSRELQEKTDISLQEFKLLAEKAEKEGISKEAIKESFAHFDKNKTGYIKASELKSILSSGKDPLHESEIKAIFDQFPANDQGLICYSLLVNYMFDSDRE